MTYRHAVPLPDAGGSMSIEIPSGGRVSRAPEQPGDSALRVFRVFGVWRGWIRSGFLRFLFLVLWCLFFVVQELERLIDNWLRFLVLALLHQRSNLLQQFLDRGNVLPALPHHLDAPL